MPERPTKLCPVCGRSFAWRKRWARCWDEVVYCSDACRAGVSAAERVLEEAVAATVAALPRALHLPLTEVAQRLGVPVNEPLRRTVRRLAQQGRLELVRHGRPLAPETARGEFALRRSR